MEPNATKPSDASSAEPTKKYIRTLESDMATLKEGGTPSFTEMSEPVPVPQVPAPQKAPPPPPVASVPPPLVFTPPKVVPPTPPVPPVVVPPPLPKMPEPVVIPVTPPVRPPEPIAPKPAPLQTYESDFSARVKDTNASVTTILAAQQDAATEEPKPTPQPAQYGRLYIGIGIVLLIAGVVGTYFAYTRFMTSNAIVIPQFSATAPIFVNEREQVTGTGSTLAQALQFSLAKPLAANTVRLLSLPTSTTTVDSVFSALRFSGAPNILIRNITPATSMAGIVNVNAAQNVFFILSVTSYSDTFAGMLMWEPTMLRDIGALFPAYPAPITVAAPVATTTVATSSVKTKSKNKKATTSPVVATSTAPTQPLTFRDEVVSNHDVRIYRDAFGQSVVLYGYWSKKTLIIARDPSAFAEIINRLATAHTP